MIELYKDEPFVKKISALIDKNPLLWNMVMQIGTQNIRVQSYDKLKEEWNENVLLLITSDSYQEIYDFILKESGDSNIVCRPYPQNYYSYTRWIQILFRKLPLRRQLLFSAGHEPHENALALVEYLEQEYEGKPYRIIFLGKTSKKIQTHNVKVLYLNPDTLRCKSNLMDILLFGWLYAGSKVLFYENQPLKKWNPKQTLVFLNHGTIPMKDVHDVLGQPKEVDYALCPSKGCSDIYGLQYGIPTKKLIYAMPPRDDFLCKNTHKLNELVDCNDKQVILWLPTFRTLKGTDRKDSTIDDALPLIAKSEDLHTINERLRHNEQLLVIKCHPREKNTVDIPAFYDYIKVVTDEDLANENVLLQEILGGTTALLTDYSGIAFEYLLLDKPIGYVISDMNSYTRGFAFENPGDYMPGIMIDTVDGLLKFLDDVKTMRDEYYDARKRLVTKIFQGNESKSGAQELMGQLKERIL